MADPDDSAERRKRERAERVEETVEDAEYVVESASYPTNPSELQATYGETRAELPNETESLGDVFDRLAPEQYDTAEEAREAVLGEITGEAGTERGDRAEYNPERSLKDVDSAEQGSGEANVDSDK